MTDFISALFGLTIIFILFFLIKNNNNKKSENKVANIKNEFSLNFYKILNKRCSIKRLTKVDFIDRTLMFEKCNILVEKDFIIIQGIALGLFDSVVKNFIITENAEKFKNDFTNWEVYKPKFIELNINKTQVKIVFKPNSINNSDYSLIISELTVDEFEKIEKIKNYC